jgi:hypothetical protein
MIWRVVLNEEEMLVGHSSSVIFYLFDMGGAGQMMVDEGG